VFKPVVALAAFTQPSLPRFTPATRLEDAPLSVELPNGNWMPENYDGAYRGEVSLREAFEQSLNVPVARLGLAIGAQRIVDTARRAGITSPLRPLPSLALGSFEVTLLEATTAYAVLAAEGVVPVPRAYTEVLHPDGRVLELREREFARAFDPAAAYLVTSLLVGAVDRGTAHALRERGFEGDIAGKTGTSSDTRDAWFIGFTPDVVIGVWVGFDDGQSLQLSGATAALPIFADVLEAARGKRAGTAFARPPGLVEAEIDPRTGLLAALDCPGTREVFLAGTAPPNDCHGREPSVPAAPGVIERLRGWLRRAL
jgi:penicillin-binding protein 1B